MKERFKFVITTIFLSPFYIPFILFILAMTLVGLVLAIPLSIPYWILTGDNIYEPWEYCSAPKKEDGKAEYFMVWILFPVIHLSAECECCECLAMKQFKKRK